MGGTGASAMEEEQHLLVQRPPPLGAMAMRDSRKSDDGESSCYGEGHDAAPAELNDPVELLSGGGMGLRRPPGGGGMGLRRNAYSLSENLCALGGGGGGIGRFSASGGTFPTMSTAASACGGSSPGGSPTNMSKNPSAGSLAELSGGGGGGGGSLGPSPPANRTSSAIHAACSSSSMEHGCCINSGGCTFTSPRVSPVVPRRGMPVQREPDAQGDALRHSASRDALEATRTLSSGGSGAGGLLEAAFKQKVSVSGGTLPRSRTRSYEQEEESDEGGSASTSTAAGIPNGRRSPLSDPSTARSSGSSPQAPRPPPKPSPLSDPNLTSKSQRTAKLLAALARAQYAGNQYAG